MHLLWCLGVAVLAAAAVATSFPAQAPEPQDTSARQRQFLLPYATVEQMRVREGIVAALTMSSMGDFTVVAYRRDSGETIGRWEGAGPGGLAFDGELLAFTQNDGAAVVIDIATRERATVPLGNGERTDGAPSIGPGRSVWIPRRRNTDRVALIGLMRGGLWERVRETPLADDSPLLGDFGAMVIVAPGGRAEWITQLSPWLATSLTEGVRPLAVVPNGVIAATRSDSDAIALCRASNLQCAEIYRPPQGSSIQFQSLAGHSDGTLTLSERSSEKSTLVLLHPHTGGIPMRWTVPSELGGWPDPRLWAWDVDSLVTAGVRESRLHVITHRLAAGALSTRPLSTEARAPEPPVVVPRVDRALSARAKGETGGQSALGWLRRQMGPAFKSRSGREARLIDSYEDDIDAGWVYDAALAAIAFLSWREPEPAAALLEGLNHLQEPDGGWVFSYDPRLARSMGTRRYLGSMAWVVMAANFYEAETGDDRFAPMARRGLDYIDGFRVTDRQSSAFGAVSMGPANPQRYSIEHNVNAFAAYRWRGRQDRRADWTDAAEQIRTFVFRELWAPASLGPKDTFFLVGFRDAAKYLDAQTWSALAFGPADPHAAKLHQALAWAEQNLRETGEIAGVRDIAGFNEARGPLVGPKVWSEGSEGMVAALFAFGDEKRAADYHRQTARYQTASGGIPYATQNSDGWATYPSVAGTAWFLVNESSPPRNPFRPDANRP